MSEPILRVTSLQTSFRTEEGLTRAVDGVTLVIPEGHTLGMVGESGSGKSVTALTSMRLLPDRGVEVKGAISFLGRDVLALSNRDMSDLRGREISMIFQEPMTSLNPVHRVGHQVAEAIVRHTGASWSSALQDTIRLFDEVGIPEPAIKVRSYPHELSGGQKQRVMIAMALSCDPKLLIADEPTTALDVTIQAQILALLRRLQADRKMSLLFITHDLGVIAEIADDVIVLYKGRVVEQGPVEQVFGSPSHPYTKGLLACRPRLDTPYRVLPTVDDFMAVRTENNQLVMTEKPMTEARLGELVTGGRPKLVDGVGEPILSVRELVVHYAKRKDFFGRPTDWTKAVDGVDLDVWPGQTLGLVGESGCGKTTLGRAILKLVEPVSGSMVFRPSIHEGETPPAGTRVVGGRMEFDLRTVRGAQLQRVRRSLQIVFQDPASSLNPRLSVEQAITEPMWVHGIGKTDAERRDRAAALLEEVGMATAHLRRYPHEFSGGQRQRICIARTLAVEPEFIVCDESVSALDVSVQAQVLNLLKELQLKRGLTYLFISHDLSVVKFMSDRMCVMQNGKMVEVGPADAIYANPQHEYTRGLIAAIPRDDLDHIKARRASRTG